MTWEDEETRDAPAWDWDGAAARGWPQRQDDRQQAELGRTPANEPIDDTKGED